jgi:sensor histidine kinase YesM
MITQIFVYGITILNMGNLFSCLLLVVFAHTRLASILTENEILLTGQRIALMQSQIQPQFLSNALLSIHELCENHPQEAGRALDTFAAYLRYCLDALRSDKTAGLVPFRNELRHTKAYLALEKLRFGNQLRYEFEILDQNFMIPRLTLQPIVENAARHGIFPKENGGTIRICAQRIEQKPNLPAEYRVTVTDDGVGFNPAAVRAASSPSVFAGTEKPVYSGIAGISARLKQHGGSLEIESRIGEGTRVRIRIIQGQR